MNRPVSLMLLSLILSAPVASTFAANPPAISEEFGSLCDAEASALPMTIEQHRLRSTLKIEVKACETSTGLVEYTVLFRRPDHSVIRHTYGQRWRAGESGQSFELAVLVTAGQQEIPLGLERLRILNCQCWDD